MAIFCLAQSLDDLKTRLGKIVVGYTRDQKPVHASDLQAHGAMTVLLKDALQPNLVQTLENNPPSFTAARSPTSRTDATR
jgi:formate--tetrahydrofolate ligase